ncbi:MAG: xanthine dehydrogenase family protein molybdopterin-binding subunit, partial [Planctomycetota bacterium]
MGEKMKVKVGFPADSKIIEVEIPDGDERPWGLDTKLSVVGTDVPRVDGAEKVTGRAKYSYDVDLPGLCHAKVLRSPHAAAMVRSIDLAAAEATKGVVATVAVRPGTTLRHQGQEIAAIAAETEEIARDALAKIAVEYEVLPHVLTADAARKDGAPLVNRKARTNVRRGRGGNPKATEEALAKSDRRVEATYRTQVQTHTCLETHGCVARWEEDGSLTVWASTQATGAWFGGMNNRFGLRGKVRVVTHHM